MTYQSEFNFSGAQLRDAGISLAAEHAEQVSLGWNERAYELLIKFLQDNKRFMAEEVRSYASEIDFELPPHARAWGGIIRKAACKYIIIKTSIQPVRNAKAHCANAGMWERNDERMIEMGLL